MNAELIPGYLPGIKREVNRNSDGCDEFLKACHNQVMEKTRIRLNRILAVFIMLFMTLTLPIATAGTEETLRLGVTVGPPPWVSGNFVRDTVQFLHWKLPHLKIEVDYLTPAQVKFAIRDRRMGFLVVPATLYATIGDAQTRLLATMVSSDAPDPDLGLAACLVVPKASPITTFGDLKGRTLGATASDDHTAYVPFMADLAGVGINPEEFFSSIHFYGLTHARRMLTRLVEGEVDAAVIPRGYLRDLFAASGSGMHETLRVIENTAMAPVTVNAYPNLVFVATDRATREQVRDVLGTLLAKPKNVWGQRWTVPPDMSRVNAAMYSLKMGPYEYMRNWSWTRIWKDYRLEIILASLFFFFLLLHGYLAEKLVRRRTAELRVSIDEQTRAQERVLQQTRQIDALERSGIVGQLSTLIAHEMKGHLASVMHTTHAVRVRLEDLASRTSDFDAAIELDEKLESIRREAERAAEIIDHVRSYAKGTTAQAEPIDLSATVETVVEDFRSVRKWTHPIQLNLASDCIVTGRRIEFELLTLNLLKNAAEAAAVTNRPQIAICVTHENNRIILRVVNNGSTIDDASFEAIESFSARSIKKDGLGLGLGIIRSLTESYLGQIRFTRNPCGGLIVEISFSATEGL